MLRSSTITIPFSGGLQQRGDNRLQQPPALDKCVDAEFDDVGGLRTRKPYSALGVNVLGGGTLSNIRKIVDNNGELLCFTKDTLYSWDTAGSVWVSKGQYLAPTVDEKPALAQSTDQYNAECAVFGGVKFVAWINSSSNGITMAVVDSVTDAVIVAPFTFVASAGPPRLVALNTRVILVYIASSTTTAVAIDPTTLTSTAILASPSVTVATSTSATAYMDACASPDGTKACVAVQAVPGNYVIATIDAALTVNAVTKARHADAIGVAISPDGLWCQIARGHTASTVVQGDLLTFPALADSTINQALGATSPSSTNTIALAFATTKVASHYRCSVFWSISGGITKTNWADDSGAIGTEAYLKNWCSVASRAFDYNGTVFVWLVFAQANSYTVGSAPGSYSVQNAFYLVDSAGTLHAKSGYNVASGSDTRPGSVTSIGSGAYAWTASVNRTISLASSNSKGYGARTPRIITVTFDDNRARRSARLGRTLYIPGGQVLGYDTVQLSEANFHVSPWRFILSATGGAGHATAGQYAVKCTYRWDNAVGERERSTTTNIGTLSASLNDEIDIDYIKTTDLTLKGQTPAVEVWRTAVNPTADSPFYLATILDPTVTSNPNKYLTNIWTGGVVNGATTVFTDQLSDAALTIKENNPENGSVLENLAPPAATIITADADRIYLAGIAGSPNVVWYSKQRAEGEIAAFNDALTIQLPATGGDITALAFLNETLIVFKATAIYALPGDGYDNTGGGNNFGPARLLSSDIGATSADSLAISDLGLVFKSSKGWYLLDRGWQCQYIGGPVSDYDTETPVAVQVVTTQSQIRILTANRLLVLDTLVNQWGEWSLADGATACLWSGTHLYATDTVIYQQRSDFTGVTYGMDIETCWVKPADPVGQCRVQWLMPLGEYRSACSLRIRIGRNYRQDGAGNWEYFDDKYRLPAAVVGGPLQVRIGPSIPNLEAIKVRLTAMNVAENGEHPTGEAIKLSALGIEFGVQPGLFKRLPVAQKA